MIKLIISIPFMLLSFLVIGQSNVKTEAEIRRLEQVVISAIQSADTNKLKEVWAPEFLVNNPRNSISAGRAAILDLHRAGMINYSSFERNIEHIQFQKDIVITMGYETFVSRTDTPGVKAGQVYKRRFTNVWMKKKGRWQQIARHASIICQ
jgi:hypothetical protein